MPLYIVRGMLMIVGLRCAGAVKEACWLDWDVRFIMFSPEPTTAYRPWTLRLPVNSRTSPPAPKKARSDAPTYTNAVRDTRRIAEVGARCVSPSLRS